MDLILASAFEILSLSQGLRGPGFKQAARIPRIHKTVDIALSTPQSARDLEERSEREL